MFVVDTNVLVYAVHSGSAHHEAAHAWLREQLSGSHVVGMPWVSLLGFIRISTNPRAFAKPLTATQALDIVETWLRQPAVTVPEPTSRHFALLAGHLSASGTAANLTTDAHIAALALEYGATVATFDRDFGRFRVPVLIPGEA